MKILVFGILCILLASCNNVNYKSVTRPAINKAENEYFTTEQNQKYEGNSSVTDINNKSNKYKTMVIENDSTYYYVQ